MFSPKLKADLVVFLLHNPHGPTQQQQCKTQCRDKTLPIDLCVHKKTYCAALLRNMSCHVLEQKYGWVDV